MSEANLLLILKPDVNFVQITRNVRFLLFRKNLNNYILFRLVVIDFVSNI